MLQKVVLLCVLATFAPGSEAHHIKVRFGAFPFSEYFIEVPTNIDEVIAKEWVKKDGPTRPAGLESLETWCPQDDYSFCVLLDDTGYPAGCQVGVAMDRVESFVFDPKVTGFTNWTTTLNGKSTGYFTLSIYFTFADYLTKSKEIRVANRNPDRMLQHGNIWMTGFNGELHALSLDARILGTAKSAFTKQACIPWMGQHYYYKMSKDTKCSAETIFPWFPLEHDNEVIGLGFMNFMKYKVDPAVKDLFEHPDKAAVKVIVNDGPECVYELADQGVLTMHMYVVEKPRGIFCPFFG